MVYNYIVAHGLTILPTPVNLPVAMVVCRPCHRLKAYLKNKH